MAVNKLSCVIPAFNEAESLPHLWERLKPVVSQFPAWEVVLVSDGSTDATVAIAEQWVAQGDPVKVIDLHRNRGKSAALMAGLAVVSGDVVVTLDADLQDDPQEIPRLVQTLDDQQVDMVGGWKRDRKDPLIKKISSKVFNGIASRIAKQRFYDLNCGLKAYRREVVETLDLYGDLYRFIPILAVANGFRVAEIPVKHHARQWGVSKYGLRLSGAFDLLSLAMIANYRWRPLHLFGRWGALLALVGIILLGYLAWLRLQGETIGDRPLLIFGALFVIAGLQIFFTGLLGDLMIHHRRKE